MIEIIFIFWCIITAWWYYGLFCYFTQKEKETTTDFGVKILTIGENEEIVNQTKNCILFENITKIISRNKMKTVEAEVLPLNFSCKASFKGEQLEWSRKEHPMNNTVYLDEDSEFYLDKIPQADIVQFQEIPQTKSFLIAMIEAHRLGFQIEQAAFAKIKPLYLWGGGFSVCSKIENNTTWDRKSITEDTAFLYAIKEKYTYAFSKQKIYSQAPLTLMNLIQQRRRWASGIYTDLKLVKDIKTKTFIIFRFSNWILSPIYISFAMFFWSTNPLISALFLTQTMIWSGIGSRIMMYSWTKTLVIMLVSPVASVLHCAGALWGIICPIQTFEVTPKL